MGSITKAETMAKSISQNGNQQETTDQRGQRLLPHVLEKSAVKDPNRIFGKIARPSASSTTPFDFIDITISQLANAVNYTAHWLDNILGPEQNQVIGFCGLQDFRYMIMQLAATKIGHVLLLPSPRNAIPNTISLLNQTGCKIIFYSGAGSPIEAHLKAVQQVHGASNVQLRDIPSLETMINTRAKNYPYTKTFAEAKYDNILIVHTSGSTGCPKPIYINNAYIKRADVDHLTPPVEGKIQADLSSYRSPLYNCSPGFHGSGVLITSRALFEDLTIVIAPPEMPALPQIAVGIAKSIELKSIACAGFVLDALFFEHGEELKSCFGKLENIMWFGGPLAQKTGEAIITRLPHVDLWQMYASTEMLWFQSFVPPKSHWSYIDFHPTLGPTFKQLPGSDLYEVVMTRHPDPAFSWTTVVFDIFPETKEWRSRDLFRKCTDPGFEHLWKFESRLDDILILNNALKVNPLHVEVAFQSHRLLSGVLVFGVGRNECGILLELRPGVEREGIVERVWGDIEMANAEVPEGARVQRGLVVVADEKRPFVRSSKGTIVRDATTKLYEQEIDEVYATASKAS